jgi:hypothetical protein
MYSRYSCCYSVVLTSICAVEAVGIGATSRLLRMPCSCIFCFNDDQSQRSDGCTPHRSNCFQETVIDIVIVMVIAIACM